MSWTYSTNVMGPFGLWWFEENNIPFKIIIVNNRWTDFKDIKTKQYETWFGGRIDCYCDNQEDPEYDRYGRELILPIMKGDCYALFSNWLDKQITNSLVSNEYLFKKYETETGNKLIFHESEKI